MADWPNWVQDVLRRGGWPVTNANVRFLTEWHTFEESVCANNPLNTTLKLGNSTQCNSAGVQSYPTTTLGARATVQTLTGGLYFAIVSALASGDPFAVADSETVAAQIRTWGTSSFATFYLGQVAGGPTLPPPPGGGGTGSTISAATSAGHRGYFDLRNSVAKHLRRDLYLSRHAGEATLRTFAQRRKVKR